MPDQPAIPETPATPASVDPAGTGSPPPPSRHLNQEPQGMVSQADMDDSGADDDTIRRQRREDNINPSRAREQPPEG